MLPFFIKFEITQSKGNAPRSPLACDKGVRPRSTSELRYGGTTREVSETIWNNIRQKGAELFIIEGSGVFRLNLSNCEAK